MKESELIVYYNDSTHSRWKIINYANGSKLHLGSLEDPISPLPLLHDFAHWREELTTAFLLAVCPLTFVNLLGDVFVTTVATLDSMEVAALVVGAVTPSEGSFPVVLSVLPLSCVTSLVCVVRFSFSRGKEGEEVDISQVLSAVVEYDLGLVVGIVIESDRVGLQWLLTVGDVEGSVRGMLLVVDDALEPVDAVEVLYLAGPLGYSVLEVALNHDILLVELEETGTVGGLVEFSVVDVLSLAVGESLALLEFVLPSSEVVLVPVDVPHKQLVLGELLKLQIACESTLVALEFLDLIAEVLVSVGHLLDPVVLLVVVFLNGFKDVTLPIDLVANLQCAAHQISFILENKYK